MQPVMRDYMRQVIGPTAPHQHHINTKGFSPLIRNRIFLTSTLIVGPAVPYQDLILEEDYEQHPVSAQSKVAPLMTPRRANEGGNLLWSDPHYAIKHLVFSLSKSNPARLLRMREQICEEDGKPILPVDINNILPPPLVEIWHLYQQWSVSKKKCHIFTGQRMSQVQPCKNHDGSRRQVTYIEQNSNTIFRNYEDGDIFFITGEGPPVDPGTGKISIEIIVQKSQNRHEIIAKEDQVNFQARVFIDEI